MKGLQTLFSTVCLGSLGALAIVHAACRSLAQAELPTVQVNVEWMRENDVVKHLLRANLHQKQYVDQVTPLVCL